MLSDDGQKGWDEAIADWFVSDITTVLLVRSEGS